MPGNDLIVNLLRADNLRASMRPRRMPGNDDIAAKYSKEFRSCFNEAPADAGE